MICITWDAYDKEYYSNFENIVMFSLFVHSGFHEARVMRALENTFQGEV